ncbi:MAG TPA: hypothetical protein VLL25_11125 [Acidimicrobiales bacterium]|nr:hypothetical protein [Acidimicrobiales bacterium]
MLSLLSVPSMSDVKDMHGQRYYLTVEANSLATTSLAQSSPVGDLD